MLRGLRRYPKFKPHLIRMAQIVILNRGFNPVSVLRSCRALPAFLRDARTYDQTGDDRFPFELGTLLAVLTDRPEAAGTIGGHSCQPWSASRSVGCYAARQARCTTVAREPRRLLIGIAGPWRDESVVPSLALRAQTVSRARGDRLRRTASGCPHAGDHLPRWALAKRAVLQRHRGDPSKRSAHPFAP